MRVFIENELFFYFMGMNVFGIFVATLLRSQIKNPILSKYQNQYIEELSSIQFFILFFTVVITSSLLTYWHIDLLNSVYKINWKTDFYFKSTLFIQPVLIGLVFALVDEILIKSNDKMIIRKDDKPFIYPKKY